MAAYEGDFTWKIKNNHKIFALLKENPKRENTKGGEVYDIILRYPEGISYGTLKEIYAAEGTDKNDPVGHHVQWDLNRGRLRVEDEKGNEVPGYPKSRRKTRRSSWRW